MMMMTTTAMMMRVMMMMIMMRVMISLVKTSDEAARKEPFYSQSFSMLFAASLCAEIQTAMPTKRDLLV